MTSDTRALVDRLSDDARRAANLADLLYRDPTRLSQAKELAGIAGRIEGVASILNSSADVGAGEREDALRDLEFVDGAKAGYRIGYRDGCRPEGRPPEPGEQSLADLTEGRRSAALAALSRPVGEPK